MRPSPRPLSSSAGWPAGRRSPSRYGTPAAAQVRSIWRPRRTPLRPRGPRPTGSCGHQPRGAPRGDRSRARCGRCAERGRGRRPHRPQRIRQVIAAVGPPRRGSRTSGRVRVDGQDPADCEPAVARSLVGLVPQTPGDLLFADTVAASAHPQMPTPPHQRAQPASLLDGIVAGIGPEIHPRDLSEGQRLALVLAIQLAASPRVLLLDEPTRGLDYPAKRRFAATVRRLAHNGHAVLVATHDAELAATIADRVLVMADGDLVADGSTRGDPVDLDGLRVAGRADPGSRLAYGRAGPHGAVCAHAVRERGTGLIARAPAVPISGRPAAVLALAFAGVMAFAWPLLISGAGRPRTDRVADRVRCRGARRRARHADRGVGRSARRTSPRHSRRSVRTRRRGEAARRRGGGDRDRVRPPHPRRTGLRTRASASCWARPRSSPRRSSPVASARGCPSRCSPRPGSGSAPASCHRPGDARS